MVFGGDVVPNAELYMDAKKKMDQINKLKCTTI
jgi:hypothetical protein